MKFVCTLQRTYTCARTFNVLCAFRKDGKNERTSHWNDYIRYIFGDFAFEIFGFFLHSFLVLRFYYSRFYMRLPGMLSEKFNSFFLPWLWCLYIWYFSIWLLSFTHPLFVWYDFLSLQTSQALGITASSWLLLFSLLFKGNTVALLWNCCALIFDEQSARPTSEEKRIYKCNISVSNNFCPYRKECFCSLRDDGANDKIQSKIRYRSKTPNRFIV